MGHAAGSARGSRLHPRRDSRDLSARPQAAARRRQGIIRAANGVIDRQGIYEQLERIATPTLILVGDQDLATPPARSERIHARIAGSRLRGLPGAGHTSTIEEPAAVNAAIADFLAGLR